MVGGRPISPGFAKILALMDMPKMPPRRSRLQGLVSGNSCTADNESHGTGKREEGRRGVR